MDKSEYKKQWRKNNPEKVKLYNKTKYEKDKSENPERLKRKRVKQKEWIKKNESDHRKYQLDWSRRKLLEIKNDIFNKLGHVCKRCGFHDKRALCIDHINGGGFSELRKYSTFAYYKKVLCDDTNMYQVLCHNCNWIKRHENNENRKPLETDKKALVNTIKKVEL